MDVSIMPLPVKFERNDMKYIYFCEEHKFITRTAVLKIQQDSNINGIIDVKLKIVKQIY
jgi:hypothetical protein